jgi:hypothetical protein
MVSFRDTLASRITDGVLVRMKGASDVREVALAPSVPRDIRATPAMVVLMPALRSRFAPRCPILMEWVLPKECIADVFTFEGRPTWAGGSVGGGVREGTSTWLVDG